jgi:hypothetical protein
MAWELPTDAADQALGANFGRPRVVPRSVLGDITFSARINGEAPPGGGHAPASATEWQTFAKRPGDYPDARDHPRGHALTGTQDAQTEATPPPPPATPAVHAPVARGAAGAPDSFSSSLDRGTLSSAMRCSAAFPQALFMGAPGKLCVPGSDRGHRGYCPIHGVGKSRCPLSTDTRAKLWCENNTPARHASRAPLRSFGKRTRLAV